MEGAASEQRADDCMLCRMKKAERSLTLRVKPDRKSITVLE